MPFAWSGADPIQAVDLDDYELGTRYLANVDVTLTHARVWTGAGEIDIAARKARVWTTGGAQLGIASLPTDLTPGWSTHAYDTPVEILAGSSFIVSYSSGGNEGALAGALAGDVVSSDGAITAKAAGSVPSGNGVFSLTPNAFPSTGSGSQAFYGSDVVYQLGLASNTPPVITAINIAQLGAQVTASVVATDAETLVGASYRFNWGDGSADTVTAFPTVSAVHTYTQSGSYAILVTVTDDMGAVAYRAVVVHITIMGGKETKFYEISNLLVTAISDALATSIGGRPQRACVVPGEIAWDGCTCGALYVSVQKWHLSETFPANVQGTDPRTTPCELPWLVGEVVIQIMRCAPNPKGRAIEVECAPLDASALIVGSDAYITLNTTLITLCELKEADFIIDFSMGDQSTQGPEGGCVGSELHAFVGIPR